MRLLQYKIIIAIMFVATSHFAYADELCRACPFDCNGIGASSKHCSGREFRNGQCCVDLDRDGQEQLRIKDLQNSSYNSRSNDAGAYDDRAGYNPGDCPSGFHVNDRKCSDDERRRGCNDMKSRSGLTCVGWHQRRN